MLEIVEKMNFTILQQINLLSGNKKKLEKEMFCEAQ